LGIAGGKTRVKLDSLHLECRSQVPAFLNFLETSTSGYISLIHSRPISPNIGLTHCLKHCTLIGGRFELDSMRTRRPQSMMGLLVALMTFRNYTSRGHRVQPRGLISTLDQSRFWASLYSFGFEMSRYSSTAAPTNHEPVPSFKDSYRNSRLYRSSHILGSNDAIIRSWPTHIRSGARQLQQI
jgi:hypothetical protein